MIRSIGVTSAWILIVCAGAAARGGPIERIETEHLERFGKIMAGLAKIQADPPLAVDADGAQANGIHDEDELGLMVIPAKALSSKLKTISAKAPGTPVGLLFLYNLSLVSDGKPVPAERLRSLTITDPSDNTARTATLLYLALRKEADGSRTLLVYSKDQKPLAEAPLTEGEAAAAHEPLDVEMSDTQDADGSSFVITIQKKYQARLRGIRQAS